MEESTDIKIKKIDPVGLQIYGNLFVRYHKIAEIKNLLSAFKEYYYQAKLENPNSTISSILRGFNSEVCTPAGEDRFYPYVRQVKVWTRKWDLDLMQQTMDKDLEITEMKNVHQIIKTRDDERNLVLGQADDNQLEEGVKTLGGELLNDAMQMLRDDQVLEEIYDDDTLIKRRNYIVNVFAHATRLVHGKAALLLKASEEKRSNAGFLISLLSRASSGKMTDEEMSLLKTSYAPKQNEQEPQPV